MRTEHLESVYLGMQRHLGKEGRVAKVSRQSRQDALDSASRLGITPAEHGELMCKIHELHFGRKPEQVHAQIKKLVKGINNINKKAQK